IKARCIAKLPTPAQKMARIAISIGLQMGSYRWKCQRDCGYGGTKGGEALYSDRKSCPLSPRRRTRSMRQAARLTAAIFLIAAGVRPAWSAVPDPALPAAIAPMVVASMEARPLPLPDPVRAMIEAAIASGERKDVETVIALAKATNPRSLTDIDAILAAWKAQGQGKPEPDPIRQMLAAAMASKKDGDVEAVGA